MEIWELAYAEPAAWRGYGEILVHGMSTHRRRVDGRLQLERTGPHIAPMTLPRPAIVVTAPMRAELEALLPGSTFLAVDLAHVTHVDYHLWDPSQEPAEWPEGGGPEGYVLERPHDPSVAAALGTLWELVPEIVEGDVGQITRAERLRRELDLFLPAEGAVPHMFRVGNGSRSFVDGEARAVVERAAPCVCEFLPVRVHRGVVPPPGDPRPERLITAVGEPIPDGYELLRVGVDAFKKASMQVLQLKRNRP